MGPKEQDVRNKADELNKLAWDVRVEDSTKALLLSEEAISLAKPLNYIKGIAEGFRTLGFSYIRISKHTDAKLLLDDALKLFIQLNDQRGESDVDEYLGIIQRSVGDYKGSLDRVVADADDIAYVLKIVNQHFPGAKLTAFSETIDELLENKHKALVSSSARRIER